MITGAVSIFFSVVSIAHSHTFLFSHSLPKSQMSVESDDKRTRTRSKGIRGECWSLPNIMSAPVC